MTVFSWFIWTIKVSISYLPLRARYQKQNKLTQQQREVRKHSVLVHRSHLGLMWAFVIINYRLPSVVCYQLSFHKPHDLVKFQLLALLPVSTASFDWTKTLGFLRSKLAFAPRSTKLHTKLVRTKLEYAAPIWSSHSNGVGRFGHESFRPWVVSAWSFGLGQTGQWVPSYWFVLESRRTKIQLILLYKIMNGMVDILTSPYVTQASARTRSSHTKKLRQISSRTDAYKYSFFPRTIPFWNSLPASIAEAPD